ANASNQPVCYYSSGITLSNWTVAGFAGSTCTSGSPPIAIYTVAIPVTGGAVSSAPTQYQPVTNQVISQGAGIIVTNNTNVACADATTSSLGCVQPDGTTITINAGVISAAGGGGTYQTPANVVMSAAQFTGNTPIELIPAQGAGTIIILLDMTIVDKGGGGVSGCGSVTFTIGTYSAGSFVDYGTFGNVGQFCYGSVGRVATFGTDDISVLSPNGLPTPAGGAGSYTTQWANLPIYIKQASTGLTTTDTFPISVSYRVMTP
ncbi:MAG TPA: hypothetical protein VK816_04845, partial [Jatrophihabitantaceae bacterium]|nr:hypothetical protein [Jatrophihabitantaceae bacterium]